MINSEDSILRRALTVYLAFLMATAPCLCCCTTGRVTATEPARPVETRSPCCCHDDPADPAPEPSVPEPPERCPCREHSEKPIQVTAGGMVEWVSFRAALNDTVLDGIFIAPPTLKSAAIDGPFVPDLREPYRSTADLLRVHHRLRC
jgi:hypothetical protein